MSVQFRCPCGATLRSNESVAGKKITCPKCGTQLQIKPAAAEPTPKATGPLDQYDWDSQPNTVPSAASTPSSKQTYGAKKTTAKPMGKWIAMGAGALALVAGISAVILMNRRSSISSAFRASESTAANAPTAAGSASSSTTGAGTTGLISGSVGPETTNSISPALKLAEEFANHARQGSADRALRMIADEDFEKRLNDGPTPSWEAILKMLKTPKLLGHLRSKSLESTPMDEAFRHWRVLGETLYEGQPAVLLRYYSDPEYPRQLISNTDKLQGLTKLISVEEFKSNATDLVLYAAKDRNLAGPPAYPETFGFLPPRFGYMLLVLDASGDKPKIVDVVNILGQVTMSQMAGAIFMNDWTVTMIGMESDTVYKKRLDKANAVGRKSFSIYGTVPKSPDSGLSSESIPAPALWFLPPEKVTKEILAQGPRNVADWLAKQDTSRTTRLVKLASALDESSSDTNGLISEFKRQYPGDPGADLAVICFAMTSLEPRMPEALLSVIDQSAESLFKTFNDPFMLFVRGLVQQAKGDQAASAKFMQQANQAGFVAMRMLREPLDQAVAASDKEAALAALKQIGYYWSKAELDKSSNTEGQFSALRAAAKNKADRASSDPGNNPGSLPFGNASGRRMPPGLSRPGSDPNAPPASSSGPFQREPGFAGPSGPGESSGPGGPVRREPGFAGPQGPGGRGAPGFPPAGFPPPPSASTENVRFVLQSKSAMDPNAILEKLKEKLKTGNFQMSHSGNSATITLGFAGAFDDAVAAVDFGKVTKKDQATRTITIELP